MKTRNPIHVLVVDDSPFMRHTLSKHLEAHPDIKVIGQAADGIDALAKTIELRPDVITLDVQMPRMDGLTALERIMAECPTPVIMVSGLTERGARVTIQSLMRGAVDFVTKPVEALQIQEVVNELVEKIKMAAGLRTSPLLIPPTQQPAQSAKAEPRLYRKGDPLIIIGSSTGGPRALREVLPALPANLSAAVVIVQHMPVGFTQPLAQRLNQSCTLAVQEAAQGDRLAHGIALVAPSGYHLQFDGQRRVVLNEGPRRNGVRPAVDITMESAAEQHGDTVIGVVLTGMGHDGLDGARRIKEAGGKIIAEHESTSVVYGMPRSVIEAGLADYVAPLPEVVATLMKLIN
ncbi:MAG: chemotaxis response regulator protein-glutamate methylesterase [Anaerolineae bacterium]|nr:chemotaxis response regulator protein-glutamate methylesterase [Anaerolineae bacterium]